MARAFPTYGVDVKKVIRPQALVEWKRLRYKPVFETAQIDGVTVETRSFFNLPAKGVFPLHRALRYLDDSAHDVDLVIAHMTRGMVLANRIFERSGIPFICILHGSDIDGCQKLRSVFANAQAVYTRSPSLKKRVEKKGINVDGVIFSGIDEALIVPARELSLAAEDELRFVSVCTLLPLKNIDIVLRALAALPTHLKWSYTIIGDGEQYDSITRQITELDLVNRVTMLGRRNRDYCLEMMRKSDVFVMPSAPETFGLAYLEAMASGCIVIGAKGWGVDGIVRDGENGYLVEPGSVSELQRVLLATFASDRERMREKSTATIREYTFENAVRHYVDCIRESVTSSRR